ncbi:MAG TPA: DUF2336 domain-containing protein [Allosphingosinicella sp.]|uniref:DUF2336 domain-containing protein n=1 Tax=Allosphingosinicella sp. TaxID=2823234 RepID=UPI002EDA0EC7
MSDRGLKQPEPMGDAARLLLAAARERFSVAATDILLPEQSRLTEWQRLTASALLLRLVRSIEDDLRARLAGQFRDNEAIYAALGATRLEIALPLLERAQVLRDAEIGTILVRRVEEHRFWKEHARADEYLSELIRDDDDGIAAEAMTLLIARSRRFDRFQEPVMGHTDLPAELQHRLVWMIAAALRQYLVQQHKLPSGQADAAISAAAGDVIAGHDESHGLEATAMRLARRLHQAGRLEGTDLSRILEEGQLPLFVAGLAVRCGLDYASAWEILSDPHGRGSALMLRSGNIPRDSAAWILLLLNSRGKLFSGAEGDAAAAQLDLFDGTGQPAAEDVLHLWRVDPGYRAAITRLSTRSRSGSEAA